MGSVDAQDQYKNYPATKPDGFQTFHESTVGPITYEIPTGSKVLDIGCNDGAFLELIRDKRSCEVYGIDPAEGPIALAKAKGLNVLLGKAEALPYENASFDVVTLIETFTHLEDPVKALAEIKRVLKPEGVLLGSLPHKNVESYIWSDKRLHKRYIDEVQLYDELGKEFPFVYVRTLTGAQFAVVWAQSAFADKPAEMLFKAGGDATNDWESDFEDDGKLRVWFGYTQLPGTVYYRMTGAAEKMDKAGLIEAAYERDTWPNMTEKAQRWQSALASRNICGNHCPEGFHYGNRVVMNHLEQILRIADVSVWQIVNNRGVLAFLRCAKDLADGAWYKASGRRKAFVTEIDDYLFDIPGYNIASHPYHANSEMEWVALEQIKLSNAIICSTRFLKDKLAELYPEKPSYVVPNALDFGIWDNLKPNADFPKKEDGWIRIGYTGCSNHRGDIESIREPLVAILKEFPNVQFVLTPQPDPESPFGAWMGWPGIKNIGIVTEFKDIGEYPHFVAGWGIDIGIAPLLDSNFNRAKSNLRWLEYSALKVPTVASRVYPFKNSIIDGQDGFICNSSQQWYDALKLMITDESRRREVGQTAYARVKRDFNMDNVARHYAAILEEIRCNAQILSPKSPDSLEIPATLAGQPA